MDYSFLLKSAEDPVLRKEALGLLKSLLEDKSEFVRYEAKLHFDRLEEKK